jgi:hypothetical protein
MARITHALLLVALVVLPACGGSGDATPTATPTQAALTDTTWQEFRSEDGRYSVLMPGKPEEETISMETDAGAVEATYARMEVDGVTYMVMYLDPPAESLQLGPDEYFRQYIDGAVQNIESNSGVDIQDPTISEITLDGNPGREFVISVSAENLLSRHRTYLVDTRQYLIQATGPVEKVSSDETARYLDSLKPVK